GAAHRLAAGGGGSGARRVPARASSLATRRTPEGLPAAGGGERVPVVGAPRGPRTLGAGDDTADHRFARSRRDVRRARRAPPSATCRARAAVLRGPAAVGDRGDPGLSRRHGGIAGAPRSGATATGGGTVMHRETADALKRSLDQRTRRVDPRP